MYVCTFLLYGEEMFLWCASIIVQFCDRKYINEELMAYWDVFSILLTQLMKTRPVLIGNVR